VATSKTGSAVLTVTPTAAQVAATAPDRRSWRSNVVEGRDTPITATVDGTHVTIGGQ
jgi:hypothetical protein